MATPVSQKSRLTMYDVQRQKTENTCPILCKIFKDDNKITLTNICVVRRFGVGFRGRIKPLSYNVI